MTERPDWGIRPEMTIRLPRPVSADRFCDPAHASLGVYGPDDLNMNPHGALSVATPTGWLGLKPSEFAILSVGEIACACGEAARCFGRALHGEPIEHRCASCCEHAHDLRTGLGREADPDGWGWCWFPTEVM